MGKVEFAGFSSDSTFFIASEIWQIIVDVVMYLHLFSIVCVYYGDDSPMDVVYTNPETT